MNIDQKGTQVNHTTTRSARTPFLRTGIFAALGGVFGGGRGSGAPSNGVCTSGALSRDIGARTPALRLAALTLATAALFALTAVPASAATTRQLESQITEANGTALVNPVGLAVDSADNLWVSDTGTHAVSKFTSSGLYAAQDTGTGSWGSSSFIESLAFSSAAAKVFVSDSNQDDLWGLDPATAAYTATDFFGPPWDTGPKVGCCFLRIAADNSAGATNGDLYVSNGSSVSRINGSTGAAAPFTSSEPYVSGDKLTGPFSSAGALAVAPSGNLFVGGSSEVDEFAPSGEFIRTFASGFGNVSGIAVDPTTGDVLIADSGQRVVQEFASSGSLLLTFARLGSFAPRGVAVDSSGKVYVADTAASAVDVFGPPVSVEPPTAAIDPPSEVSFTSAHVSGTVNPEGHETICRFEFVSDAQFSSEGFNGAASQPCAATPGSGSADVPVEADLSGLSPSTTYHVRLLATNAGASTVSAEPNPTFETEAVGPPTVTIEPVTNFTATTAHFVGQINPNAPAGNPAAFDVSWHFECTPGCPGLEGQLAADNSSHEITADASGLLPGTTYEVSLIAANAGGQAPPAGPVSFTTLAVAPVIDSTFATEIGTSSAALNALVNPGGAATTVHFEYITDAKYKADGNDFGAGTEVSPESASIGADNEDHLVTETVNGLLPLTTYHFRAVATNSAAPSGVTGPAQTFETLPPVSIDSTSASAVTATSATLETELNPHGLPTTYHFEYDTVEYTEGGPAHGESTPTGSAGAGTADVLRSVQLQGLAPSTTYHFRAVASNALGTSPGPDRTFTTQPASPGAVLLPDARAWELVSPPEKNGVQLEAIGGFEIQGPIQAAADGSGLAYLALGSIDSQAAGNRSVLPSQLLARRTPGGGWSTRDIATPHQAPAGVTIGNSSEYKLFSTDLSLAAVEPEGATPLSPEAGEKTPYLRLPDGSYQPLVNPGNVPAGTKFGGNELSPEEFSDRVELHGTSPDLSHLVLSSAAPLTAGLSATPQIPSLFGWSAGQLSLISQIPAGAATLCGGGGPACVSAAAEGSGSGLGGGLNRSRNAISADGERTVFANGASSTAPARLFLRDQARGETLQLNAPQGGPGGQSFVSFRDASADGSRIFFTDTARLTADANAAPGEPDLYLCQVEVDGAGHLACALRDLSADPSPGQGADVLGVIGTDRTGGVVYFVANGALTEGEGAVPGNCGRDVTGHTFIGECNLYRYDVAGATTRLVAVLAGGDSPTWGRDHEIFAELTSRVSPDGRWLAFMSSRPLTGYDNRDARSGEPLQEVFLYDAASGVLRCASCNPSGARPRGILDNSGGDVTQSRLVDRFGVWEGTGLAASIPGWTPNSSVLAWYQSRYLSDSGRLFFNAADALVPQDSNSVEDVYQYEPPGVGGCTTSSPTYSPKSEGCVDLISSGASGEESAFLDASESGNDVFFLTASQLAPTDVDAALDVYDAHVCTAASPCPPPPAAPAPQCAGDACQPPAVPPNDPTPGSLTFNGAGNVVECPKGKVKKSGKCVARKHKKAHKKHAKKPHRRAASHNRGGQK